MISNKDGSAAHHQMPPILHDGFRPFFLAAGVSAALAASSWVAVYLGWLPAGISSLNWHIHEMFYGFLPALVAGFTLTAIPNWTSRRPLAGWPLAMLFAVWLAGRLAAPIVSHGLALSVDLVFLIALCALSLREIVASANWRNLPVALLLALFAISHLAFHFEATNDIAQRGTIGIASLLIALIGGRIVPAFTRNWLADQQRPESGALPAPMQQFDIIALGILVVAIAAWIAQPDSLLSGVLLLIAGAGQIIRLARWQGPATWAEPMVWSMHAGFAWIGVGTLILGLGVLQPELAPPTAGIHALAAGGIGTMGLAVMTRASLGHSGRQRRAGPVTTLIYLLAHAGALLRVISPLTASADWIIAFGMGLWSGAFALFVLRYAPILFSRRAS